MNDEGWLRPQTVNVWYEIINRHNRVRAVVRTFHMIRSFVFKNESAQNVRKWTRSRNEKRKRKSVQTELCSSFQIELRLLSRFDEMTKWIWRSELWTLNCENDIRDRKCRSLIVVKFCGIVLLSGSVGRQVSRVLLKRKGRPVSWVVYESILTQ